MKDVNYRTEETPSESENVNNNHAYEYDANGNLVYVNTSRTKKDGVADEKTTERKLKWDEENRLIASDDNGFVTNYWYDADGERTVKTSGESDQVYVNSEFAGGRTNTAKFSLYVSPYLVANQGGRYTKHIYIGSQRVVSKIGDFDSYGSDPRRIQYAGSETDGLSVDYKAKYTGQLQVIKDNYATFAVPYNGEDNNDYVDGKGFCCNDGSSCLQMGTSRRMTITRRCSSTTTQTIWVAVVTSLTLTVRWCSISSMFLSEKYSLRSAITFGIRLILSMLRNSMRRRDCITMVRGTMIQRLVCGLV